jgi:hypothetical protein
VASGGTGTGSSVRALVFFVIVIVIPPTLCSHISVMYHWCCI